MLNNIKHFFEKNFMQESFSVEQNESQMRLAAAALFIEMMMQDGDIQETEKQMILNVLQQQFLLSSEQSIDLYRLAEDEIKAATDYHQFTRLIAKAFEQPQKIQLIENLWRVAFADNQLDKYEENMVRKIADLIYVPHKDFIQAKHRVQQSLA